MSRRRTQRGVATIELMMLAPLLFLVLMGMVQLTLVALARSAVGDAALAAARADALGHDPQSAADQAMGRVADSVRAERAGGGSTWRVTAHVVVVFPGADVDVSKTAVLP